MKIIQPIQIWQNGTVKTAELLNSYVVNDNLKTEAIFYYSLLSSSLELLSQGNLTMTGTDYENFTSNDYAYSWVATQLNIVIIGDSLNKSLDASLRDISKEAQILEEENVGDDAAIDGSNVNKK
jgi:hypothetical protein